MAKTLTPDQQSEFDSLKQRADLMGLNISPNIGLDTLRKKVNAAASVGNPEADPIEIDDKEDEDQNEGFDNGLQNQETQTQKVDGSVGPKKARPMTRQQVIAAQRKEANALVRIRVACMNPNKKDWEGEIFTVSNPILGTFKKYVPFNNEAGWHVPQAIYNMIIGKKMQTFVTVKDDRGNKIRQGRLVPEYSVTILPALTQAELNKIARDQRATDNN